MCAVDPSNSPVASDNEIECFAQVLAFRGELIGEQQLQLTRRRVNASELYVNVKVSPSTCCSWGTQSYGASGWDHLLCCYRALHLPFVQADVLLDGLHHLEPASPAEHSTLPHATLLRHDGTHVAVSPLSLLPLTAPHRWVAISEAN